MTTDRITGEAADDLEALMQMVEGIAAEELQTFGHSCNVADYAVELARLLGVDGERIEPLRRAAVLHDIGKSAVPDAVLTKPGPLTEGERAHVRRHAILGEALLRQAGLHQEASWVRSHHERYDGGGYPDGLAGEAIPLEARIIFVADAFETMTSDRPYRLGMPVEDAVTELHACAGTQFDPVVVEVMVEVVLNGRLAVRALRRRTGAPPGDY